VRSTLPLPVSGDLVPGWVEGWVRGKARRKAASRHPERKDPSLRSG